MPIPEQPAGSGLLLLLFQGLHGCKLSGKMLCDPLPHVMPSLVCDLYEVVCAFPSSSPLEADIDTSPWQSLQITQKQQHVSLQTVRSYTASTRCSAYCPQ